MENPMNQYLLDLNQQVRKMACTQEQYAPYDNIDDSELLWRVSHALEVMIDLIDDLEASTGRFKDAV